MTRKLRSRLTYANAMATIAVFVALGGSSYAAFGDHSPQGSPKMVMLDHGQEKVLLRQGPFSISARCTLQEDGSTLLEILASSTKPKTLLYQPGGGGGLMSDQPYRVTSGSAPSDSTDVGGGIVSLGAPGKRTLSGLVALAVHHYDHPCSAQASPYDQAQPS